MAKRSAVEPEPEAPQASKKMRDAQQDAAEEEVPHRSSSTPEAAKRKSDHIDNLFGGLKKQKKASVEAEYNSSDAAEDEWDEQERPRCSKRKGEVEDLFATLKKQRSEKAKTQATRKQMLGKRKPAGSKDDIFGEGITKPRRRDAEGFAIYSEDELGLNKGGSTHQCPFECKCCF